MYEDLTSDLSISFSFDTVGGIETKTKHDSSNPPCINGERRYLTDEISACMTAPLASKNFVGLEISRDRCPTIFSLPFSAMHKAVLPIQSSEVDHKHSYVLFHELS